MNDQPDSSPPREGGTDDDQSPLRGLLDWFRPGRRNRNGDGHTLEELIEERADAPMDAHERLLIGNILHLRDVTAVDVMVPRADIVAVEAETPFDELVERIRAESHSRMPVYRGTLDDVLGMVHIKDVLTARNHGDGFSLQKLLRRVLFVAPSMRVLDLLLEMRLKRTHMAMVVDEFGGIDGLITIEDLVEQIVGEIEDEHDTEEDAYFTPDKHGGYLALAKTPLDEFEEETGLRLTEAHEVDGEEVDTLGGLVFMLLGRVPVRGEVVEHPSGASIEVIEADPRRIKRLRVRLPDHKDA